MPTYLKIDDPQELELMLNSIADGLEHLEMNYELAYDAFSDESPKWGVDELRELARRVWQARIDAPKPPSEVQLCSQCPARRDKRPVRKKNRTLSLPH